MPKPTRLVASLPASSVCTAFIMALVAPSASAQANRSQDPEPPFPYTSLEVSYTSPADGTSLAGTLTVPDGEGPFPAAILISGAGPQDRDYGALGHRPFLVLADHLSRSGIAVLRVDDRGVGGSGSDAMQASVGDVVADLAAGLELLAETPAVDPRALGLIAHSEGARVAPVAAMELPAVGFMVLLSPPTITARDLGRVQALSAREVLDDPMIPIQAALVERVRETVRDQPDPDLAMAVILERWDEWLVTLPDDQSQILATLRDREEFVSQLENLVSVLGTPWNRELYGLDTSSYLASVQMPVLALYGDLDRQAPPRWNIPILQAAWRGHPDATIRVLTGLNHFLQTAETGLATEVPALEETLSPAVMEAVSEWIGGRFNP